jgi:RHS repeat-associated protein
VPYTHRYAYDAVGNFTTNQEYTRSALKYKTGGMLDRFDGFGVETYGYDANGNTTSTPRHTSLGYQWDSQPTLIDLGGGGKVRYRRHGDQKVLRFKTTGFRLTLGAWEYENRTAATAFTKTTLHVAGPSGRCAQVEKVLTGADATSLPVFQVHGDHLGSGQCLTKADGTLLCQEEFFAYGRSSDRRDTRNRYRFIGVERDEDTGLCMTGPRTYDPVSGRFLQGDPVVGGAAYVYSRGNPVGRLDDNGYADDAAVGVPEGWRLLSPEEAAAVSTDMDALFGGTATDLSAPTQSIIDSVKSEPTPDFSSERGGLALRLGNGQVAVSDVVTGDRGSIDVWQSTGAGEDTFAEWTASQGGITGALHAHSHEAAGGGTTTFTGSVGDGAPGIPSGAGARSLEHDMKDVFKDRSFPVAYAVVPDNTPLRRSTITAVPANVGNVRPTASSSNTTSIKNYITWIAGFAPEKTYVYASKVSSNATFMRP